MLALVSYIAGMDRCCCGKWIMTASCWNHPVVAVLPSTTLLLYLCCGLRVLFFVATISDRLLYMPLGSFY